MSIACQKNVCLQVIIADDGSEKDYFAEEKTFLESSSVNDLFFSKNQENQGTVLNIWNAVQHAKYDCLSFLSPGDYYYDDNTLYRVLQLMKNNDYQFIFGKIAPYKYENGSLIMIEKQIPFFIKPYISFMETGNYQIIQRNLVVFRDYIAGASFFWNKALFLTYLERIVRKVIYMEDIITLFALLDQVNMGFLNSYVVWYEYGTGVSTNHTRKWKKILDRDQKTFFQILSQFYPDSKNVHRATKLQRIKNTGGIKAKILTIMYFPDRFFYLHVYNMLFKERLAQRDPSFLESLHERVNT